MSKPFEFLDEEVTEEEDGFPLWIPLTIGALIIIALLSIPLYNILKSDHKTDEWANFTEEPGEIIEVSFESENEPKFILGPPPSIMVPEMDYSEDQLVDATLSSLGTHKEPAVIIKEAAPVKKATPQNDRRVIPLRQPTVKTVAGKIDRDVTVQPGDTLYRIAKQNGSTPDEIASASGIDKNTPIRIGQNLKVPVRPQAGNKPNSDNNRISPPNKPKPRARNAKPFKPLFGPKPPKPDVSPYMYPTAPPQNKPKPIARQSQPVQPIVSKPARPRPIVAAPLPTRPRPVPPSLFPITPPKPPEPKGNPLDKYNSAIAYRVQTLDSIKKIADAHATSPEELIELNGRTNVRKGEMLVVPVDSCLIKNK